MYDPTTGRFEQGNLQDWQHAAMYSAFMISGFIDLLGFYLPSGVLPQGTEHVMFYLPLIELVLQDYVEPLTFRLEGNCICWKKIRWWLLLIVQRSLHWWCSDFGETLTKDDNLQGFLGVSLLVEGLLFAFHLKGTALDMRLHLILVLIILSSAFICFLEIQYPRSFLLSTVRSQLMLLQGLWFYQIASILFEGSLQAESFWWLHGKPICASINVS